MTQCLRRSSRVAPAILRSTAPSATPGRTRLCRLTSAVLMVVSALSIAACSGDSISDPSRHTGTLTVDLSGIPNLALADVKLVRDGHEITPGANGTFSAIPAGSWTLTASPVVIDGVEYRPEPASVPVVISASGTVTSAQIRYAAYVGALNVTISGLPSGSAPQITVTGPGGFTRTMGADDTFRNITPGRYHIVASRIVAAGGRFDPAVPAADVDVVGGPVTTVANVVYGAAPVSVGVDITGVPGNADAAVTLTNPAGTASPLARSARVDNGVAGRWRVSAAAVTSGGFTYAPTPPSADSSALSGDSLRFRIRYAIATGAIAVAVTGLPDGTTGSVLVSNPATGWSRELTATTTLTDLAPGTYLVSARDVDASGQRYRAAQPSREVTVTASLVAAPAPVEYAPLRATLVVGIAGAPGNPGDVVRVTGPNGFERLISATSTIEGLVSGTYTVTAFPIAQPVATWRPATATQTRTLAGDARDSVGVNYVVATGSVATVVSGLPDGVNGLIRLTGPNGFSLGITATTTATLLEPGVYTLVASPISANGVSYLPDPATRQIAVAASLTAAPATVTYAPSNATLVVWVAGLPAGTSSAVTVAGPGGFTRALPGTTTLTGLAAGTYTISSGSVGSSSGSYAPSPSFVTRAIASGARDSVAIVYSTASAASGSVAVTISGLPAGVNAAAQLTGGSESRSVSSSSTATGLAPGSYTLSAAPVSNGGSTYTPTPASQTVTVTSGVVSPASIAYSASTSPPPPANEDDLIVRYVYLTQATQRLDGSVSLVANRNAFARVFVTNSRANTLTPSVRLRLYNGTTLVYTTVVNAQEASVRTAIAEGTLSSTWNAPIPANLVQPGLRVLADVDPTATVVESDRTNNVWPVGGTPGAVTVVNAPTFNVRFVPVTVGALTGNVTVANADAFLADTRMLHPISSIASSVRAPFVSSAPTLQSNDGNSGWTTVLSELNALRVSDGVPAALHYYGVVKVTYTSGVAGLGYVPGRSAMGWDYLPSGNGVAAHEWGHNFSRPHTPCGVSGDASYPYASGSIGQYGWHPTSGALIATSATDYMSYCSNTWTSDWSWTKVLQYRSATNIEASALQASANTSMAYSAQASPSGDGLLVWGHITNGRVTLEPAFRVTAPPTPGVAGSEYRVDALDSKGATLLSLPVDAPVVDHVVGREERQFAVVLQWTPKLEESLASLRVVNLRVPVLGATRVSEAMRAAATSSIVAADADDAELPEPAAAVERSAGAERLRWNGAAYPFAVVRDAASGQITAFLRKSGDAFQSRGKAVTVEWSDGVRTVKRRVEAGAQPR